MNIKQILIRTGFIAIAVAVTSVVAGNQMQVSVFQGDEFSGKLNFNTISDTEFKDIVTESKKLSSKNGEIKDKDNKNISYKNLKCDVLVVGGGAGGTSAAIAASRLGAKTCLLEESKWLGGMLTSAGVSAIDGHSHTVNGIFKEFIDGVDNYYKGINKEAETKQCLVSYMCFEPGVGRYILNKMVKNEKNLSVYYGAVVDKVYRDNNTITGVSFKQNYKGSVQNYNVKADITVDATEFGDLMYLAKVPYDLGIDKDSTEELADKIEDCIQPLTYVAILKDFGRDMTIEEPKNYDEDNYKCIVKNELCEDTNSYFDKHRLANYGLLPDGKLMINIPSHSYGNDFDITGSDFEFKNRDDVLEMAKDYTRGLVYFMQTKLGYENYSFSNDFLTDDGLAIVPYVRESRRLRGVKRLVQDDIMPTQNGRSPLEPHSIAIGEYPIDLHFCKTGVGDIFQELMPYQIPYEVTVPEKIDGFMVAEKNISVSHIVNGSTRLQPVVMGVGQAVGTAAYLASFHGIQPRDVNIEELQTSLLEQGVHLSFFNDVKTYAYFHTHVNYLALNGIIGGYKDFNFRPFSPILREDFNTMIKKTALTLNISYNRNVLKGNSKYITRLDAAKTLEKIFFNYGISFIDSSENAENMNSYTDVNNFSVNLLVKNKILNKNKKEFNPNDNLSRADAVVMIARIIWSLQDKKLF